MQNVTVRNTGPTPLGLPGKPVIDPGASMTVSKEYLDSVQERTVVAAWFADGALSVVEQAFENADENTGEVLSEKESLIQILAGYGIKKTARTSLENLAAEVERASAEENSDSDVMDAKNAIVDELLEHDVVATTHCSLAQLQTMLEEAEE